MTTLCIGLNARTVIAEQDQLVTGLVGAISKALGLSTAFFTFADDFWIFAEVVNHSLIENVQRSVPESIVPKFFAVTDNSAFYLIDLFETAVNHYSRENFTTNSTRAVRDNWLIFKVVVLSRFHFSHKIVRS